MKKETTAKAPIYVLSASLLISSIVYANQAQSASQYVTTAQYKKDISSLKLEVSTLHSDIDDLSKVNGVLADAQLTEINRKLSNLSYCVNTAFSWIEIGSTRTNYRLLLDRC